MPDVVFSKYETLDVNGNVEEQLTFLDFDALQKLDLVQLQRKIVDYTASWLFCTRTQFLKEKSIIFETGLLGQDDAHSPRMLIYAKHIALNSAYCYQYRFDRPGSICNAKNPKFLHRSFIPAMLWQKFHIQRYDATQLQVAKEYVRRYYLIMLKLTKSKEYRQSEYYQEILRILRGAAYILAESPARRERFYYNVICVLGVRACLVLLDMHEHTRGRRGLGKLWKRVRRRLVQSWLWQNVLKRARNKLR